MSVFKLCEQAIGLVRGKRLILSDSEKALLENLDYEGLTAAHVQDEAVVCALHFEQVRDKLLMMYPWRFSRVLYEASSTELHSVLNIDGWKYSFPKPPNCASVLGVLDRSQNGTLSEYEELGVAIHTNAEKPTLVYTLSAIGFGDGWPAVFKEAFIAFLAAEIAPAVTGDVSLVEYCTKKGLQAVNEARQLGLISSVIASTVSDDLKERALNLARGQHDISPTSEAAVSGGIDSAGRPNFNCRVQLEQQACIRAYDSVRDRFFEFLALSVGVRKKDV